MTVTGLIAILALAGFLIWLDEKINPKISPEEKHAEALMHQARKEKRLKR